ncbi:nitroreductase family protein [Ureibacillus chungkukjangi]|uniref:nitroreductase family protein n=1 Tax=Ureibacillus chungkukjangi TaxID=1202712 RepID=UPI00384F87CF
MKKVIKKVVSEKQLHLIINKKNNVSNSLSIIMSKVMSKTRFTSSIYYLFSGEFSREHQSVLYGKLKYLQDIKNRKSNRYLLRRNIHRIEKGLLMKPMRDIFALKYIEETLITYRILSNDFNNGEKSLLNELKWANDVLTKYFEVTAKHPLIVYMKEIFQNIDHTHSFINLQSEKYIPYARDFKNKPEISYDNLLHLVRFRRSVRWFEQTEVSRELIDRAIEIGNYSPSACNRQPYTFRIFDKGSLVSILSQLPMGTSGYWENIPTMVAIVGDLSAYPNERDRHLIYIDSSLAAMSFILGLETQGLSSCIINWPDIESREKEISKFLNLNKNERVIMLIAIGYPDIEGKVAYSKKKDLEEIRVYN